MTACTMLDQDKCIVPSDVGGFALRESCSLRLLQAMQAMSDQRRGSLEGAARQMKQQKGQESTNSWYGSSKQPPTAEGGRRASSSLDQRRGSIRSLAATLLERSASFHARLREETRPLSQPGSPNHHRRLHEQKQTLHDTSEDMTRPKPNSSKMQAAGSDSGFEMDLPLSAGGATMSDFSIKEV